MSSRHVIPVRIIHFMSSTSAWCPPIREVIEEIGEIMEDLVDVYFFDIDLYPEMIERYEITKIPTIYMNSQKIVNGGYIDDDSLREIIWSALMEEAPHHFRSDEKRT